MPNITQSELVSYGHLTTGLKGSLGGTPGRDSVGSTQLINNEIGYEKLTVGLQGSLGGVPGENSIGTTQIKKPGVGSSNIASNAVYAPKIAANAVGYNKLTTGLQGSLGGTIPDHSIGSQKLILGSVIIQSQIQVKNYAFDPTILFYPYAFGIITDVKAAGTYITYDPFLPFADLPTVVLTPEGIIPAVLDHAPAVGSFKAKLILPGTENVHWIAMGPGTV